MERGQRCGGDLGGRRMLGGWHSSSRGFGKTRRAAGCREFSMERGQRCGGDLGGRRLLDGWHSSSRKTRSRHLRLLGRTRQGPSCAWPRRQMYKGVSSTCLSCTCSSKFRACCCTQHGIGTLRSRRGSRGLRCVRWCMGTLSCTCSSELRACCCTQHGKGASCSRRGSRGLRCVRWCMGTLSCTCSS